VRRTCDEVVGEGRSAALWACEITTRRRATVGVEQAVATLRAAGLEIPVELLQHLSPLGWEHIVLTGEYRWTSDVARRPGQRRELRPAVDATVPLADDQTKLLPYRIPEMMS
jgi:hypothetical protein